MSALYGLLAEFADAAALCGALERVRRETGFAPEAYSPFPVEGALQRLGAARDRIPLCMLLGALAAGGGTFAMEWYSAVLDYPLNVGGRPLFSWPAFLPPAIEMTLLGAALCGVAAMLIGNRLPRVHHPLFAVRAFERATQDRFFLLLRADDPAFEEQAARALLERLAPLAVHEVPA